jgi:hypothetical protein
MLPRLSVANQRQTATKRVALCCGFVVLSYLAIVGFGRLQRTQASENILPDRRVSAPPTKIQPKLVASYGKLPLSFEANQGQTGAGVRFLARGGGYTIFLTADEAVLTLKKSSVVSGQSSVAPTFRSAGARVAPTFRSADAGLKSGATASLGKPTTDNGPRTTGSVLRMKLVGANAKATVTGAEELPGKSDYFIGNDPKKWRTNVPSYAQVKYEGVYPGVDLVYYGNQRQLEYDFVVAPGADPNQIKLSFAGAEGMRVDAASGDLVLKVGEEEVRFQRPAVYQPAVAAVYDRRRRSQSAATAELDGTFVLASNNEVAFRVAGYDRSRPLVIDPVLSYSTYLGGSSYDEGFGIAVDSAGSAYVTGVTISSDFPTANPLQSTLGGGAGPHGEDAFVAKLNPAGTALVYSTYLGGSDLDGGWGIAVDAAGDAYVTGWTESTDFPTANPVQSSFGGGEDAFVAKLNPAGTALVYSTYLGGSSEDIGRCIAVDATGNAYMTGLTNSADFPTANPLQPSYGGDGDAFVAKLNAAGSALVYSTYLGGTGGDYGYGIAVDAAGNAYVTGIAGSTDFPTTNPPTNCGNCGSNNDGAFVAKLNPAGSALLYVTFLGGGTPYSIAVDATGNAYITGYTDSTDFPTANPLQPSFGGGGDAFVAKLNPAGSALVYSTYLGGSGYDEGFGIAVDAAGNAYVTGQTSSTDFPTANSLQSSNHGGNGDAFVAKLNPAGSALVYSTYLGGSGYDYGTGIAADAAGNAYLAGFTRSTDFPTANPLQSSNGGGGDALVVKLSPAPAVTLSTNSLSFAGHVVSTTSAEQSVILTNSGDEPLSITTITVSGDFALATTASSCPYSGGSVASQASCTINVTFTPTAVGARSGTLTITDNGVNSPQTIALAGTGQDFTLAASPGSSTSATVASGQSATYTLSVAGEGGFNQSVGFTCTGAPSEATCTVSPSPMTPGSSATNVTVSVTTTAPSVSAPRSRPLPLVPPLSPGLRGLLMLALVLAAMAWAVGRRNQPGVSRLQSAVVLLASGLLLTLALAGCGGGGGSASVTPNPGTPPGTYTLTVTGATGSGSATLSHSVTLTLTVS